MILGWLGPLLCLFRQKLVLYFRLASNSQSSSCVSFLTTVISGMSHGTQLVWHFKSRVFICEMMCGRRSTSKSSGVGEKGKSQVWMRQLTMSCPFMKLGCEDSEFSLPLSEFYINIKLFKATERGCLLDSYRSRRGSRGLQIPAWEVEVRGSGGAQGHHWLHRKLDQPGLCETLPKNREQVYKDGSVTNVLTMKAWNLVQSLEPM